MDSGKERNMRVMQLTKTQLQEKLMKRQQIALEIANKQRKNSILAKGFLEDWEKFSKVLNEIPNSEKFNVIDQHSKIYNKKNEITCLFDSFSIVLLQEDDNLYIYYIAEYKLK